jgi:ubiquitin-conjugating enzyme E2 variant
VSQPSRAERTAPSRRPRWLVALEVASLACAFVGAAILLLRLGAVPPLAWIPLLALAAALGWACADFASGLVHFLCDRFGDERMPLLGPAVIRPFREHHVDPRAIASHGFVELSGNSALALVPLLAVGHALAPSFGNELSSSAALVWLMSASVGLFATNQIHRWAHMAHAPRLARGLRRCGLAITPEAHERHHASGHDRAFCITSGWCNGALDRARAWARLERRLSASRSGGPPWRDDRPRAAEQRA